MKSGTLNLTNKYITTLIIKEINPCSPCNHQQAQLCLFFKVTLNKTLKQRYFKKKKLENPPLCSQVIMSGEEDSHGDLEKQLQLNRM